MTAAMLDHRFSDIQDTGLDELVTRAQDGDGEAWAEIIRRFDDSIRRVVRAHELDPFTSRDMVQQTWLTAVSRLRAVRSADSLGGWLRTIARRECRRTVQRRRKELAQQRKHSAVRYQFSDDDIRSEHPTPEDVAIRAEQRRLLRAAWQNLPERDRTLLTLLMDEPRRPYAEISRNTGLPVGSIGPTRARCLARLRIRLAELGIDHF
jgi:RNA polymerase sigma factor (sigma-70 family)